MAEQIKPEALMYGAIGLAVLYVAWRGVKGVSDTTGAITGGISSAAGAVADGASSAWDNAKRWMFGPAPHEVDISTSIYTPSQVSQIMPAAQVQRANDPGSTFAGVAGGNQALWWADPTSRISTPGINPGAGWGELPGATFTGGLGSRVY